MTDSDPVTFLLFVFTNFFFVLTSLAEDKNESDPTWMDGKMKVDSIASYSHPVKSCTSVALMTNLATVTKSNALINSVLLGRHGCA